MSSRAASPSVEWQSGVDDTGGEQRVVALAATRLAHEASAALQSQAKLVDQVHRTAVAALARIAGGAGTPAEILTDVTREIAVLRDLVSTMPGPEPEAQFCRPDLIIDHVVEGARGRAAKYGVAIDYIRSFSNFTMFGAPAALAGLLGRCIDAAARHCGGGTLFLRANFYDAHDGRRMLRLVISGAGCSIGVSGAELKALAAGANGATVAISDGSMIVMLRAPLAAPALLFSAQPDVEEHGL
ncbi:MAG: hypothetical protein WDN76_03065 [Alphaproteobacteria bacterium]